MKREIKSQHGKRCAECGREIPAGTFYHSEQEGLTEYVQCQSCHDDEMELEAIA